MVALFIRFCVKKDKQIIDGQLKKTICFEWVLDWALFFRFRNIPNQPRNPWIGLCPFKKIDEIQFLKYGKTWLLVLKVFSHSILCAEWSNIRLMVCVGWYKCYNTSPSSSRWTVDWHEKNCTPKGGWHCVTLY